MKRKNEEKILTLRGENEEMKRKLAEGPCSGSSKFVGKSITTPTGMNTIEEPKPTHTQEVEGESYLNKLFPTSGTLDISRRHSFTD